MKKLLILFLAILNGLSAVSQTDSVTYGISVVTQGSALYLSKINASDGSVARISANAVVQVPGANGRTLDPLHRIFYYSSGSDLLAFDLATGELIRRISITNYLNSTFRGMVYNYRDSTLYGIAVDAAGLDIRLAKLDPFTGSVTPVSDSSVAASYSVLTGTALDPLHSIYYFATIKNPTNHLIGVDLHSGNRIFDTHLGIDSANRLGPMEYNCHDSTLYGLAGNIAHGRKFARIDPANGAVTFLSTFYIVADTLLNEQATIDPFQQVFYFEAMDRTYRGVDIHQGILVSYTHIAPLPGSYFTGFLFNHNCYFHGSSSIGENKKGPELTVFPNPVFDKLTIRSSVPLVKVEILDFTGKSVLIENCYGSKEIQADLYGFPEGIYVARINSETASVSSKFIKLGSK
ncbi:MAG: T9SS type A sorting domain-containing protein [Bacteroidetes bacterium]|nr:T9SS type A sorting domain-containing protein [Bacteroidota bacterium]